MATKLMEKDKKYSIRYSKIDLKSIANSQRFLPRSCIAPDGIGINEDFINYAQPLIGDDWPYSPIENGLQRFTRLDNIIIEKNGGLIVIP